jgi:F-box/WD-40 domain protein 4
VAREALASNQTDPGVRGRSQEALSAREKVRVGRVWSAGGAREGLVAVQSARYMPRLQLEAKRLWVSWGSKIWCHPRLPGGGVSKTTSRVLRGHSDDVSKFVVSEGMVVSGGRDRSLCGWSATSGEFLFARRYCHQGEVTAVDVTAHGSVIVTGSRDTSVLVWSLRADPERDTVQPVPVRRHALEDRVWAVAVSPQPAVIAVGTAATRGVAPLRFYDLVSGGHLADLGVGLKRGAGMLDLAWLSPSTLLSCGYDTFTRLWDMRCPTGAVRAWEEEYDESVYCLATDRVNCLVTGTSRHGR